MHLHFHFSTQIFFNEKKTELICQYLFKSYKMIYFLLFHCPGTKQEKTICITKKIKKLTMHQNQVPATKFWAKSVKKKKRNRKEKKKRVIERGSLQGELDLRNVNQEREREGGGGGSWLSVILFLLIIYCFFLWFRRYRKKDETWHVRFSNVAHAVPSPFFGEPKIIG